MDGEILRDTIAEIDLDHIGNNVKIVRKIIGNEVAMVAVIKGDAYGHGAVGVASVMMENGADYLAVATLTEALELRKYYKDYKLMVLGYTPDEHLRYIVDHNIIQSICSIGQAEILGSFGKQQDKKPIVHIKYDSGMHRLGYQDSEESIEEIKKIFEIKEISVEGIFSHLAGASEEEDKLQYDKFTRAIAQIESEGYKFKYKHLCESIATISYPEYRFNMVRVGTIVYGIKSYDKEGLFFNQALSFKTKINSIRKVGKGEGVGYNYSWRADKNCIVGTLPLGFADGYSRKMSDEGYVVIHGKKAPIIGNVCMDLCMVDLTDINNAKIGDEVIIYGDGTDDSINIEMASQLMDVTRGEILSRISRRTPRVYIKEGQICKVLDHLVK